MNSDDNTELLKGFVNTVNTMSSSISELTAGINKLVISEEKRLVQDEHNIKEMRRIERKINVVDDRLDKYIPTLIKAEEWQGIRVKVLTGLIAFFIIGIAGAFFKFA
jgi:hypothetical protein